MDENGTAAPPQPTTVGARLAAARAGLGLSLEDIAQRTRIPLCHLEAIEAGSGQGLPALTYASGFVRSYAGAVGLDPNALSRDYRQELGALPPTREAAEPWEPVDPARVPPWWLAIVALVIALVVAGAYALWRGDALFGHGDRSPAEIATTPPPGAATTTTVPLPATPSAAAAAGPVVLTATSPVWIRVSDGDRRLFMGVLDAGKSFAVPADAADPRLRTGRPQALRVTVGGAEHAPLGTADQILREVSLRAATLGQSGSEGGSATPPPTSTRLREEPVATPSDAGVSPSSVVPTDDRQPPAANGQAPPASPPRA